MPSPIVLMRRVQDGLLSPAPRDRMEALVALLALPDVAQARALLADHAARDADERVRQLAAGCSTLLEERIGAPAAVPPPKKLAARFRELLEDPRPRIRLGALAQVLKYKGGILAELVEEAMEREAAPDVLAAMCAVMGQRGTVAHLGTLAGLVSHEDAHVAAQAVHALALLGGASVRALIEDVASTADLRVAAAADAALAGMAGHEAAPARPVEVHQIALALTSHDQRVRLTGLEAARSHLDDPAILGLVEVLSELDMEAAVSQVARTVLGVVEAQSAAEPAAAPLGAPDPERSWQKLPPRQLAERRLRARLSHRDEAVRERALLNLKQHPVKALLPLVLDALSTEESPRILALLIHCAGRTGGEAEVPRLAAYLAHGNPAVVRAALIALWRLAGDEMQPLFLTLLARSDERVQEQALAALLRMGPEKLLAYVMTMARSPRQEVRERALTLLARIPTPAVEDIALDMLEREQSDRLIAREIALIARTASPRSIPLIWTVRRRRGALFDAIAGLVTQLSERWGLPVEEIRARGDAYLDLHPELLSPPEATAAKPARARRWRIVTLAEEMERGWAVAGVLAVVLMVGYHLDQAGIRTQGAGGAGGEEQRMIESAHSGAIPPPPPPPERFPDQASFVAALEEVAASYQHASEDPTESSIVALARAQLIADGFTGEKFIDMEARGQVRGPANRAILDARARLAKNDAGGAAQVLSDALAKVELENILVRCDLARELARAYVAAKKLREAREAARLSLELARQAVAIRRATPRPQGGMMAGEADEAEIERSARDLDAAFEEAERRLERGGSITALTADEVAAAKRALDELRVGGKISADEHAQALAQLKEGPR